MQFTKWVACWGNATSITDRKESVYSKDITLRYPIRMCFAGNKLRFHFSNLTGTEAVTISEAFAAKQVDKGEAYTPTAITFDGKSAGVIPPGQEILSDEISLEIVAGETIDVSLYFADFVQMNAGTLITGPLSSGKYSYGNFAKSEELPADLTRNTNWFYFLNTIDVLTEEKNFALVCYGDSITAQDWPDYLSLRCAREGFNNVSIIRRAVSGTRILRQYDCITYAAYGLKGATRFPIELNVAGARTVIIQHGINDIIHPVGTEINPFRPWSDMPTTADLIEGVENIYVNHARKLGLKVWSGTLLPIFGWRTYNESRDVIRNEFNQWLRSSEKFDGCVDFDKTVRDSAQPEKFAQGFDSGDHLHPSAKAYEAMAQCVPAEILR
ncbi:MAG: GDSL-type esterase/lipase family protein [Fibrobacter sp.]|nr:GDSL-type esterase/lipase family protein [Fibrobacter sp.]